MALKRGVSLDVGRWCEKLFIDQTLDAREGENEKNEFNNRIAHLTHVAAWRSRDVRSCLDVSCCLIRLMLGFIKVSSDMSLPTNTVPYMYL